MANKRKGLQQYTVQEGINARNGQAGFDIVPEHNSTVQTPGHGGRWVALQCVAITAPSTTRDYTSASDAEAALMVRITAAVTNVGDDLGATFMQVGDIIYGDFASVVNHTDSTAALIAYRG